MCARRASGAAASVMTIVGAVIVPKCPLCIAAVLAALGVSGATAFEMAPFVRAMVIGAVALSWLVVFAVFASFKPAACK